MMTRNFEQINAPHLHSECRVGTKELIDEYMAELGEFCDCGTEFRCLSPTAHHTRTCRRRCMAELREF